MEVDFVKHLNRKIRGQRSAVIEAKFASVQQASEFRMQFVKSRMEENSRQNGMENNRDPDRINVTPVARLATRVRIEVLHSVANLMKRRDPSIIKAYCRG